MKRFYKINAWIFSIVTLSIIFSQSTGGQTMEDPERSKVLKEVKEILAEGDRFMAIEYLHSRGDHQIVATRYLNLVLDFYWKEHALSEAVFFAWTGIQYSLIKAHELEKSEAETAAKLRSTAKAMAYNLASFAWPGWDEKGIVITQSDLIAGLDAARLNLRLARELNKGAAAAHWMLGAQYMANGNIDEAIRSFGLSREKARKDEDREMELMLLGYIGVAMMVDGERRAEGQQHLDDAIGQLQKLDTEDSSFYTEQLKTALRVFSK